MSIKAILIAAASFAVAAMGSAISANADPVLVSGPAVHENLSVYFVHGARGGGTAPLTLDQAMANGSVKIHETDSHPLQIENVSNQSVFIQLGDLIRGGMQDQVVGTTMLLPPHSGLTSLVTFCVDPFRSSARDGEDAKLFSATGAMFPSRMALLSILADASDLPPVKNLREQAIWWSIDSVRAQLAQKLGEPMESPKAAHWTEAASRADIILAARGSAWKTSMPLALEDRRLVQAQQAFANAFRRSGSGGSDVVGAVFAINGQIVDADVYQSHALFRAMWPKLLRAYAAEALATDATGGVAAPSHQDVSAFLATAAQGESRDSAVSGTVHESEAALFKETVDAKGQWLHRGYVAKLASDAAPVAPEALLVRMIETGQAQGQPLSSFDSGSYFLIRHADTGWAVDLPPPAGVLSHYMPAVAGAGDSGFSWVPGLLVIMALLLRPAFLLMRAIGRGCVRVSSWLLAAVAEVGEAAARSVVRVAVFMAAVLAAMVASLHPARLAAAFGSVRPVAVATRRGYGRRVPAFAAVLAIALVVAPILVGLW